MPLRGLAGVPLPACGSAATPPAVPTIVLALDVGMRIALALNRTLVVPRHHVRGRWEGFPELFVTERLRAAGHGRPLLRFSFRGS